MPMADDNSRLVPRFMRVDGKVMDAIVAAGQTDARPTESRSVRPFLVTGGRTEHDRSLAIESVLLADASPSDYSFEHASILEITIQPTALAEVAAHLRLPIGTIKVLVSDLVSDEALRVRRPAHSAQSPSTIRELINAVSSL